jgi:hypothetical protein
MCAKCSPKTGVEVMIPIISDLVHFRRKWKFSWKPKIIFVFKKMLFSSQHYFYLSEKIQIHNIEPRPCPFATEALFRANKFPTSLPLKA